MKKAKIYTFCDGNMAGCEWSWTFTLAREADGTFMLSAKHKLIERDPGDEPFEVDPAEGLTDGNEIYEALCEMLAHEFVNDDPTAIDREAIAAEIAKVDKTAAELFLIAKDRAFEEDEEKDEDELEAAAADLTVRSGRLSKMEEAKLYAALDAPKLIIRGKG